MSEEQDVSIAGDQDQVDDQLNDEDDEGLFGSGTEDEQSEYGILNRCDGSKLNFLISVVRVLATNVANLMMPNWILETMKADLTVLKRASMNMARNRRCTIAWQISWTSLLAVILSRSLATARYGKIQAWPTEE